MVFLLDCMFVSAWTIWRTEMLAYGNHSLDVATSTVAKLAVRSDRPANQAYPAGLVFAAGAREAAPGSNRRYSRYSSFLSPGRLPSQIRSY
jgi:hypothetical protein